VEKISSVAGAPAERISFAGSLRGVTASALAGALLAVACLLDWASVHILVVFARSYAGIHFGEGQVTLALALTSVAVSVLAAFLFRPALFALPVLGAAALTLTSWKYADIGSAFASPHRFPIGDATAGSGLVLAVIASSLLLGGGVWAALDEVRGRAKGDER
jgi:hypothetical protein